jgi:hypothetical protein
MLQVLLPLLILVRLLGGKEIKSIPLEMGLILSFSNFHYKETFIKVGFRIQRGEQDYRNKTTVKLIKRVNCGAQLNASIV